jgi:hypothetical protein
VFRGGANLGKELKPLGRARSGPSGHPEKTLQQSEREKRMGQRENFRPIVLI